MEKKIIPVALVVLCLSSILLLADNIESAYAVTFVDLAAGDDYDVCDYYSAGNLAYCIDQANSATNNLIRVSLTTNTVVGTVELSASFTCTTGSTRDLDIVGTTIYILYDCADGINNDRIIIYSVTTNTVTSTINGGGIGVLLDDYITATSGLIFVFTTTRDIRVYNTGGTLVTTYETANAGSGVSLFNDGTYLYSSFSAGVNNVQLWNIGTSTQACNANIGTDVQFFDLDTDNNVVVGKSGNSIVRFSTTCTISNSFGVGASAVGLVTDEVNNYYYVGVSNSIVAYDYSASNAQVFSVALTSQGTYDTVVYSPTQDRLLSPMPSSNTIRIFTIGAGAGGGDETAFCQQPENANLLRCRLEAQGGALSGNFANNPFDISNSTSNILIQVGFLDGSDTNPATNGTGYLILAIALIIANVLLYIGTSGGAFTTSNLFLPALISFVIIAGFTVGGLVDATVLIISVVALIALSAPKLVAIVGGIRGGGDSS